MNKSHQKKSANIFLVPRLSPGKVKKKGGKNRCLGARMAPKSPHEETNGSSHGSGGGG